MLAFAAVAAGNGDLEEEARYLQSLLNGWQGFAVADIQWLDPLLAALAPDLAKANQAGLGRE
jgi:hypothetical protein